MVEDLQWIKGMWVDVASKLSVKDLKQLFADVKRVAVSAEK